MLQIVTKMYFREGVPLHETLHRDTFYTNCSFLRADPIELPVGELLPSTGSGSISAVSVAVTEYLEKVDQNGEDSILVATGGIELLDSLADVLSFALNAIFSRDHDLVRKLVPDSIGDGRHTAASKLLRDTFDSARYVPEGELDDLRDFLSQLLLLRRRNFEAALQAIRQVVRATQRAAEEPTVAYVDLVAALESLSEGTDPPPAAWDRMDPRKRQLMDAAIEDADPELADRVRGAMIEAERLGAGARFRAFVLEHTTPNYFREGASGAILPVRGPDLERALKLAYGVRSRYVHALEELAPEAYVLGERADTVVPPNSSTMLSLEGLARLARHVIRNYVFRAPTGVDPDFNWRASLPGILHARLAPQYWVWNATSFDHTSASRYLSGFLNSVIEVQAGREDAVGDMTAVLERIEELLPSTAEGEAKQCMIGLYALWHRVLDPSAHRPGAQDLLAEHADVLAKPSVVAFTVVLLSGEMPAWSAEEWETLALSRREDRGRRSHLELPAGVDASLQVIAAEQVLSEGDLAKAQQLAGNAVEERPGDESLITWESQLAGEVRDELDLTILVTGVKRDDQPPAEEPAGDEPS
jgi:hypothetical protein